MTDTKPTPLHVAFANMAMSFPWKRLTVKVQDIMQQEKNAFFSMEDEQKREEQRLKVKHIEEFWGDITAYVTNSQSHNPKEK